MQTTALNEQEKELVALVAAELSDKEIAAKLFMSDAGVSQALTRIRNKLGCDTRVGLAVYACKNGLA